MYSLRKSKLSTAVGSGFIPDTVADVLRQADVFAFPSLQEGLPVAVMEAMQAGLPVVGLNIRGNRDLIENKKGGFLLEEDIEEGSEIFAGTFFRTPLQFH